LFAGATEEALLKLPLGNNIFRSHFEIFYYFLASQELSNKTGEEIDSFRIHVSELPYP
jgi:hypothetical protein